MNDYHFGTDQLPAYEPRELHPQYEPGNILATLLIALLGLCTIAWSIGISPPGKSAEPALVPVPDPMFTPVDSSKGEP